MPGTLALRLSLLAIVGVAQFVVVTDSYQPNAWGRVAVPENPVPLDESPLRRTPAVFFTMSAQTYSIIIPRFHPDARWASIGIQHKISSGTSEHRRLQDLLTSPLPKYLVLPLDRRSMGPQGQLGGGMGQLVTQTLATHEMEMRDGTCEFLNSQLARAPHAQAQAPDGKPEQPGFWFCPIQRAPEGAAKSPPPPPPTERYVDVIARVEQACPRFFPAANGSPVFGGETVGMIYTATDVRLMIDQKEQVFFKYFRAMNPTYVGSVADIRRGAFKIPCGKLPGRYVPPWAHE